MTLKLSIESLKEREPWTEAEIELPKFDYEKMVVETMENPKWVHFGAGNIFRGFIAMLQQKVLNMGMDNTGIIAVEAYDYEIIDKIYKPHDNLGLLVIMNGNGILEKTVVGSIADTLAADVNRKSDWSKLKEIFKKPSLQMASLTITEKGYSLKDASDEFFEDVQRDIVNGPENPTHIMSKIVSLAYIRYKNGELPIAFVSMDNCSHNGDILHKSLKTIADEWVKNGLIERGFLAYIDDPSKVAFPWSMIDKITPRPSESVKAYLDSIGFTDTEIVCTDKNTFIAPFVNAEGPEYLVIEDNFPNGRMPLELVGVFFTDRDTVDKVEKMKVCTCLNPLHTTLAVFGCLLGYKLIADEMKDSCLKRLVEGVGYDEGLPVVIVPGIFSPKEFIKEVIEERFPNPYIPDTPQRIITDTSQKMAIRFGETIKAYRDRDDLEPAELKYIPLVIAGWCRYLLGLDDEGKEMELSPDPMAEELRAYTAEIKLGHVETVGEKLRHVLSNEALFGLNLYEVGLGEKIEEYFKEMIAGKNSVRETLRKHLDKC
ncbi:mannitol dehydrogenase family protein [Desulfitibacter alkalitolerans]|uniref:mannitol dehydrogenase family protein n=1 Tax=Desulfitibacter alkalitolerans TaxID=264641 RepID=UPI0004896AF8|nr:mannitol dehydrogenase family protein [Desulfitibacter alkalitolerans]